MKKAFLVFLSAFLLVSCSWNIDEPELPVVTTPFASGEDFLDQLQNKEGTTYEPTSKSSMHSELAVGDGVFHFKYNKKQWPIFYNPATDQAHYMCFDPSCTHKYNRCLANMLIVTNYYCYIGDDLYCLYQHREMTQDTQSGLARISRDGSELEMLYRMDALDVTKMEAAGGYVFIFKQRKKEIYRYDIENKEMKILSKDGVYINGFIATEKGLILHTTVDGIIYTDYDLGFIKKICNVGKMLYSNEKLYHVIYTREDDGETIKTAQIWQYDMATDQDRVIAEVNSFSNVLCANDEYFYYSTSQTGSGYSYHGKGIGRINIATGEQSIFFEHKDLTPVQMYCVNGEYYGCMQATANYDCWLTPKLLNTEIFGKFTDADGNGQYEFKPFQWDISVFEN